MGDEAANRLAGAGDRTGLPGGSPGEQSPLQARAAFLKNRDWELVVRLNRGACERGRAQHGQNSEGYAAAEAAWRARQPQVATLEETIEFLRRCHRQAPFLFFNGNTFADVGRTLVDFLFAEMPTGRRREVMSAVAHYIAGVLDRDAMAEIIETLSQSADFKPGDSVKTLRGSLRGVVVRVMDDGRLVWKPDGTNSELIALPESLVRDAEKAAISQKQTKETKNPK